MAENTTLTSVSFRLMDRAARSPFHCGMGHVGVRARATASLCVRRLEIAVRRSAGALAATRQQSYGCACSDVRWGSTGTTSNIITIVTTYTSHGGCQTVCASGGGGFVPSALPGLGPSAFSMPDAGHSV